MKIVKVGLVLVIMGLVISIIFINKPNATYKTVEEHIKEGNTIAFMQQEKDGSYTKVNDIPYGYDFNSKKSICTNNAIPIWENNKLKIVGLNKNKTDCYLYFSRSRSMDTLEKLNLKFNTFIDNIAGPACESGCGDSSVSKVDHSGLYIMEDNFGQSYYYRGTLDNNWVKFGQTSDGQDIWWRIIRINGNGSLRLIYAGVGESFGTTGNGINAIEDLKFNNDSNDNTYMDYYYGAVDSVDFSLTHSNLHSSNIANNIDDWYMKNIKKYEKYIDENAGFCNNKQISTTPREWWASEDTVNRGTGKVSTAYNGWKNIFQVNGNYRLDANEANLKCGLNFDDTNYERDYYTWKDKSIYGNKALINPIGLITVDEVVLAGGFGNKSNTGYWLYTGQKYWTISPSHYSGGAAIFYVNSNGSLSVASVSTSQGVRPVINLKADTKFKASVGDSEWGTKENPYIVEVTE